MRKSTFSFSVLFLAILSAVILGVIAGRGVNKYRELRYKDTREGVARSLLESNLSPEVGDIIPDHLFENLSQESINLSTLVHRRTLLSFVQPDCPSCLEEIAQFQMWITDTASFRFFVLISSENPRLLQDLVSERRLPFPVLYDHRREFESLMKVGVYPFNILVDEALTIRNIYPGALVEEEVRQIEEENRIVTNR